MGTAFSASMFGLAGALVLGFLDLTAGQAQNRFFNELEEWLAGLTRLSSGALGGGRRLGAGLCAGAAGADRREHGGPAAHPAARRGRPRAGEPGDAGADRAASRRSPTRCAPASSSCCASPRRRRQLGPALQRLGEQRRDGGFDDAARGASAQHRALPPAPAERRRAGPGAEHGGAAQRPARADPHGRRPGRGPAR